MSFCGEEVGVETLQTGYVRQCIDTGISSISCEVGVFLGVPGPLSSDSRHGCRLGLIVSEPSVVVAPSRPLRAEKQWLIIR